MIYFFNEGNKEMKDILGQKGANICEIYNLGIPTPEGFIITHMDDDIESAIKILEKKMNKKFEIDMSVSVRSSPIVSMPGMMDTVLNVNNYKHLRKSIKQVFNSWYNKRAHIYREKHGISHDFGMSVIIQTMVLGNKNNQSGTGVIFSRNPNNGKEGIVGEYLINSQGEDIVLGNKTPINIENLKVDFPDVYSQLEKYAKKLELHFQNIQDIEFTFEDRFLYILQTRNVKKPINKDIYEIKDKNDLEIIAKGIPSSYGAATGKAVFSCEKAKLLKEQGEQVILIRPETSPEDIEGIIACDGIITLRGGATSHAAIVARSMNKPCICGCGNLNIKELEWLTIDGSTGDIILGKKELVKVKNNIIKY